MENIKIQSTGTDIVTLLSDQEVSTQREKVYSLVTAFLLLVVIAGQWFFAFRFAYSYNGVVDTGVLDASSTWLFDINAGWSEVITSILTSLGGLTNLLHVSIFGIAAALAGWHCWLNHSGEELKKSWCLNGVKLCHH